MYLITIKKKKDNIFCHMHVLVREFKASLLYWHQRRKHGLEVRFLALIQLRREISFQHILHLSSGVY